MFLQTDEQTITDLGIFGRRAQAQGIYDLYNRTQTRGGEAILKEMFLHPLCHAAAITRRSHVIEHFARLQMKFPFSPVLFDMTEKYITDAGDRTKNHQQHTLGEKEIQQGVVSVITLIQQLKEFVETDAVKNIPAYSEERNAISLLTADAAFEPVLREKGKAKLAYTAVAAYDNLFRVRERSK